MDYYNIKLRLHGNVNHEVLKQNLSAPEVIVLRAIHGEDGVLDVKYSKTKEVDASEERERLALRYNSALSKLEPRTNITHMFGGDYLPLVETLKDVAKPAKEAPAKTVVTGGRTNRPAVPAGAAI